MSLDAAPPERQFQHQNQERRAVEREVENIDRSGKPARSQHLEFSPNMWLGHERGKAKGEAERQDRPKRQSVEEAAEFTFYHAVFPNRL